MFSSALLPLVWAVSTAVAKPRSTYSAWAADSAIARSQGNGVVDGVQKVNYEHGEFQWALRRLFEKTKNVTYFNYIKSGADTAINAEGVPKGYSVKDYNVDPVRTGPTFLYLYEKTKSENYKTAATIFRKQQLDGHPRTKEGQFWHKKIYFNQGWLDGTWIYMAQPFYAEWTRTFEPTNTTAWNDIGRQFTLIYKNTLDASSGLLYHGYDWSKTASWASSDRGHAPHVWGRAVGWYFMALVDTLEIIPTSHSGHQSLRAILQALSPKAIAAADPNSGVWWLVIDQPGREGNYFESSGSVMIVYGLLKGLRKGWISDPDGAILVGAKKAYIYMVANWVVDKGATMDWLNTVSVGSLGGAADYDYYISQTLRVNDLKGLSAFILASLEYEAL